MQNRKLSGRQRTKGFPGLDQRLKQGGGIPLCDYDFLTSALQPVRQELALGRLTRPIQAFESEQPTGFISVLHSNNWTAFLDLWSLKNVKNQDFPCCRSEPAVILDHRHDFCKLL